MSRRDPDVAISGVRGWFGDGRAPDRNRIGDLAARFLGAATATYAVATLVRPAVLTGPVGMPAGTATDTLVRAVGVRDVASGLASMVASRPREAVIAAGVRIGSDLGDAIAFGLSDLPADGRRKAVAVALAWAALNAGALALRLSTSSGSGREEYVS